MWKVFVDTLTQNERWSRKSIMLIISFTMTIITGGVIVISGTLLGKEVSRAAVDIFDSLLIFVCILSGVTVVDKKIKNTGDS